MKSKDHVPERVVMAHSVPWHQTVLTQTLIPTLSMWQWAHYGKKKSLSFCLLLCKMSVIYLFYWGVLKSKRFRYLQTLPRNNKDSA